VTVLPHKILVVDDEPDVLELFQLFLRKSGYETEGAEDAKSAFKKLMKIKFDLILLDVMLPDKSGLDFCQDLADTPFASIPVIMVSAKVKPEDIRAGIESGAKDYITKPVDFNLFLDRIKSVLSKQEE
jgi:DNA-binding response OmpR family regulator